MILKKLLRYSSPLNLRLFHINKNLDSKFTLEHADVDFVRLNDVDYLKSIKQNIAARKGVGNIQRVIELKNSFDNECDPDAKETVMKALLEEIKKLPNKSHPLTDRCQDVPCVLRPAKQELFESARDFNSIAKDMNLVRTERLAAFTGTRSYYLLDALANLESALVKYFLSELFKKKFEIISVPDLLPAEVIESCGMEVRGKRSQVYFLDEKHGKDICLSGTAEMALAGLIENETFDSDELPLRLAAVSRCYRSEISNLLEERGIYRVHQFTKVEMFGVCEPEQSESLLEEFLSIEESNFEALKLDFQILDMPKHELGAPAYRKHDIEAWFPGRKSFGEISSCSNCTDYQSRRLQTRFRRGDQVDFVHTVNGTACAIPRTIMALVETHQAEDGVRIPRVLQSFFGSEKITKRTGVSINNLNVEKMQTG